MSTCRLCSVLHLTPREIAAVALLRWYCEAMGALPADEERVRRVARLGPKAWARGRAAVLALFVALPEGGWRDATPARAHAHDAPRAIDPALSAKRAAIGRRGGLAKARLAKLAKGHDLPASGSGKILANGAADDRKTAEISRILPAVRAGKPLANAGNLPGSNPERESEKTNPSKGLVSHSLDAQEEVLKGGRARKRHDGQLLLRTFRDLSRHKDRIVAGRGPPPAAEGETAMEVDVGRVLMALDQMAPVDPRLAQGPRTGFERWDAFLRGLSYSEQRGFSDCVLVSETEIRCRNEYRVRAIAATYGERLRAHFAGEALRFFHGDVEAVVKAEAA